MFNINIEFGEISVSSIEEEDITEVEKWLISQKYCMESSTGNSLNPESLYQRFLEYYVSECEFFLKLNKGEHLIGIFKGRIEFKNPNQVCIWCFLLEETERRKGIGSLILKRVMEHFYKLYGIYSFFVAVVGENKGTLNFWKHNGFEIIRVTPNYLASNGSNGDLLILNKEGI